MFFTEAEDRQFAVKPMNCPAACLVYGTRLRSYRDLPIRYADFGRLHRAERSGVITGLTRVRTFCQDDAHIFCTQEQVTSEVLRLVETILEIYNVFGFEDVTIELSTRPEKSIGSDETWEVAEAALRAALDSRDIDYRRQRGRGRVLRTQGRFPHPRRGGSWLAARHRAARLLPARAVRARLRRRGRQREAAGADPSRHAGLDRALFWEFCWSTRPGRCRPGWRPARRWFCRFRRSSWGTRSRFSAQLCDAGLRAEVDVRDEKLGYKIRDAQVNKVPYMIVIGGREEEAGAGAVRLRTGEDLGAMPVADIVARLRHKTDSRSLEL